jgi:hypothetical protein
MSDPLALGGDFADLKTVKSRSTVQMVIELPIEEGERIVRMFGFPQPSNPVRVAIARLAATPQIEATAEPAANSNGHRSWRDLTPAQQAGIRCNEPAFQKFLREEGDSAVNDDAGAAAYVRLACGVHSRAHLVGNAANKWRELEAKYQAWMHPA